MSEPMEDLPERGRWAPTLAELLDVYTAWCQRAGRTEDDSRSIAAEIVTLLAQHFGGRLTYLPKGQRLFAALKHAKMWREFNGKNVRELSERYDMNEISVYEVLAKQRVIELRKRQLDLFG